MRSGRRASQKKKYVLRHAIFCGSQPPPDRLNRRLSHHAEPDGSANPHRSIVVGWAMLRWLIHPQISTNHPQLPASQRVIVA